MHHIDKYDIYVMLLQYVTAYLYINHPALRISVILYDSTFTVQM